ncbi:uncharacterized protein LOC107783463 isoform X2 [Nicotiana tabacum]|uniref:Uncharacterized protein LOC107783463 isoform X2 n=2 Tax=Nicotiana TaxID=4085 RepID=A0A1S3Z6A1_TOBAC|nr:PREDICTED: uncharacterized protein LOC104242073 isoform X2 [Nicotiana sylvestris]XP_016459928.1 PREDICTED: uncharacterized protein LOC107783463 isoform X2 [Nicotiana tabacum]
MSSSSLTITLSSSLRSSSSLPLLLHRLLHRHVSISSVLCTRHLYLPQKQLTSRHLLRRCSVNGDNSVYKSPEFQNSPLDQKGIFQKENHENSQTESLTSNNVLTRLRKYGVAGVLSYGLLNTAYYLTTFLIVWFYVAPSPGRMGYLAAVERFLKVMAMVWAGSQVTKLVRAGGALALAPFVDRGLSWFTTKMNFESQGKAFMVIAGFCFGLAFMMFLIVTLLWA